MKKLKPSKIQKEYLKKGCPMCKGEMHEVPNNNDTEIYSWCRDCLVSMDSNGGYTC